MATYDLKALTRALEDGAIDSPPLWASASIHKCAAILQVLADAGDLGCDLEQISDRVRINKNTAAQLTRFLVEHKRISVQKVKGAKHGLKNIYFLV